MTRTRCRAILITAASLAGGRAQACSVCMGAANDTMTRGMQVGILVLLGVIGSVLLGLGGFIGYLVHRGRMVQSGQIKTVG
jgi:hypothetical protein